MKNITAFINLMLVALSSVQAASIPQPVKADSRLREVVYDSNDVIEIHVRKGVATHIVLERDEKIKEAAPGLGADCAKDELDWCIIANVDSNNIYVKPKSTATYPNNLNLVTDKRIYSFEFIVLSKAKVADSEKMFRVTFKYPDTTAKEKAVVDNKALVQERLEQKNKPRNWNYAMEPLPGSENITPSMAYDDGRFTYLRFPNNRDKPAIFAVNADGTEATINFHMEDIGSGIKDTVVIHRVYPRLVLRLGKAVVGVWNDAYDPDGIPSNDGVTVEGIKRVVRGQRD